MHPPPPSSTQKVPCVLMKSWIGRVPANVRSGAARPAATRIIDRAAPDKILRAVITCTSMSAGRRHRMPLPAG